jgi:hypothetical protein
MMSHILPLYARDLATVSPKIGISLGLGGWAAPLRTPAQRVAAALLRVRDQGIPLCWGEHGVLYRPLLGGWHRSSGLGVSLVGCVVLAFQPDRAPASNAAHEDPETAAARALAVPIAYVAGLRDGWDRAAHSFEWLGSVHRAAYLNGYEAGMEARFRETRVCGCGTRRFADERACPGCDMEGFT